MNLADLQILTDHYLARLALPAEVPNARPAVRDGDTFWVRVRMPLMFHALGVKDCAVPVRLARIDAPETKGETRPAGLLSAAFLAASVSGRMLVLDVLTEANGAPTTSFDRVIGEVWFEEPAGSGEALNLSDWMVAAGHAWYQDW